MWACPLPSLSFLLLPDVKMLFACLLKKGSHLLFLLFTLVLVSHFSFVCIKMPCPLQPFVSISFVAIFVFVNFFLIACFLCVAVCVLVSPAGGDITQMHTQNVYLLCMSALSQWHKILMSFYWLHFQLHLYWIQGNLMLVMP